MKFACGALCIERDPKSVSPDGADAAIADDDEAARGTRRNGFMRFPL
jgi:hypothetical protein